MGSLKILALAGAMAIGAIGVAQAADMPLPPPPPMAPEPLPEFSGWYLRGDVGAGITQMGELHSTFDAGFDVPGLLVARKSVEDQFFVGAGFGYQFNNWFRADLTGEYRGGGRYAAIESYTTSSCGGAVCFDNYNGNIRSSVFLANGYVDLGTWVGVTPFVGAGVGFANHKLSGLTDVDHQLGGYGFAGDHSKTNFAWALMAGLGYNVSPNLKLELGYRYLNMGDVESGAIRCQNTPFCGNEVHKFSLASHDLRLGMRWMLGGPTYIPEAPQMPLIRKY
ncbi:outer membrane protein [Alsobacter sp. KACC 23698]|uniref:Outer membrane protein n=1 Tax=Alsobacter sp. KACC 23698 TaxID=3149229 RepID=A0AAU7JBZ8_9HYPH